MSSNKEGLIGGVIGGALATLGLMKISKVVITSSKQIIPPQSLNAGATATLLPQTTYKFAIILFHGDGESQIQLTVKVNTKTFTLSGSDQAIEIVANETIEITATNTDTASPRSTPTIEIASISW